MKTKLIRTKIEEHFNEIGIDTRTMLIMALTNETLDGNDVRAAHCVFDNKTIMVYLDEDLNVIY